MLLFCNDANAFQLTTVSLILFGSNDSDRQTWMSFFHLFSLQNKASHYLAHMSVSEKSELFAGYANAVSVVELALTFVEWAAQFTDPTPEVAAQRTAKRSNFCSLRTFSFVFMCLCFALKIVQCRLCGDARGC